MLAALHLWKDDQNSNAAYFRALSVLIYFQFFCTVSVASVPSLSSPVSLLFYVWLPSQPPLLFRLLSVSQSYDNTEDFSVCCLYMLSQWHRFHQETILWSFFVNARGMLHKLLRWRSWSRAWVYLMLNETPQTVWSFGNRMVTVLLMCQKAATNINTLMGNFHGMDRTGSCMVLPFPSQPLLPPDIQVKAEKN